MLFMRYDAVMAVNLLPVFSSASQADNCWCFCKRQVVNGPQRKKEWLCQQSLTRIKRLLIYLTLY